MNAQLNGDLVQLLEIKKELLLKLLEGVKHAAVVLKDENMDAFDQEMEGCKKLMATIDETGATADSLKRQMPDSQVHPGVARLESDTAYILGEIEQARSECNNIAEQTLKTYGRQIKAVRGTQRGIDGYANQLVKRDAVFIDAKKINALRICALTGEYHEGFRYRQSIIKRAKHTHLRRHAARCWTGV